MPFVYYWFHGVATYFQMVNWRCPVCQHRFAGLRMGEALWNPIYTLYCNYCGRKAPYVAPMRDNAPEKPADA